MCRNFRTFLSPNLRSASFHKSTWAHHRWLFEVNLFLIMRILVHSRFKPHLQWPLQVSIDDSHRTQQPGEVNAASEDAAMTFEPQWNWCQSSSVCTALSHSLCLFFCFRTAAVLFWRVIQNTVFRGRIYVRDSVCVDCKSNTNKQMFLLTFWNVIFQRWAPPTFAFTVQISMNINKLHYNCLMLDNIGTKLEFICLFFW